jgi:hypothetical protein
MMPMRNPMRGDDIEDEFLSSEVGLVYLHELQYANGALYKGQIKPYESNSQSGSTLGSEYH